MHTSAVKFNTIIFRISYIYIAIPILIFFSTWLKWYYSVFSIILILFGLVMLFKNIPDVWQPNWDRKDIINFIIAFFIIVLWVYFSGIGGFVYQNSDHYARNQIFEILVNFKWPIIKQIEMDGIVSNRGLIYYIAFWLPAAALGKILGISFGYFFQAVWTVIGIWLFYYMVCIFLRKVSIVPLIIFIFFSGLDILGMYIIHPDFQHFDRSWHIEWWSSEFQFSSFTTQLFWVFNQAMPLWLFVMLILLQKNNKYIVFIISLAVLYGPFPFIGLIPICFVEMLGRHYKGIIGFKNWIIKFAEDTFTIENVLCGGFIGIVSYLYLKGNIASQLMESSAKDKNLKGYFFVYIIFFMLEAGIYFIVIIKNNVKNRYFYVSLISLLISPIIKIGYGGDFCMRTSIPALILLYLMVIQSMYDYNTQNDRFRFYILIAIFLIGSITPFHEFDRTIVETKNRYIDGVNIALDKVEIDEIFTSVNFSGDIDGIFFYEKMAK